MDKIWNYPLLPIIQAKPLLSLLQKKKKNLKVACSIYDSSKFTFNKNL